MALLHIRLRGGYYSYKYENVVSMKPDLTATPAFRVMSYTALLEDGRRVTIAPSVEWIWERKATE